MLVGVADGLGAVACAGLGEDVIDVRFDGCAADHERGGDLGVGEAGGDEFEDFDLAGGRVVGWWPVVGGGVDDGGDQPLLDRGVAVGASGGEGADRSFDLFGSGV